MTLPFFQRSGWMGREPTARAVLRAAFEDSRSIEYEDLYGWADKKGYDMTERDDCKTATDAYRAIERNGRNLEQLFGSDYDTICSNGFENWLRCPPAF